MWSMLTYLEVIRFHELSLLCGCCPSSRCNKMCIFRSSITYFHSSSKVDGGPLQLGRSSRLKVIYKWLTDQEIFQYRWFILFVHIPSKIRENDSQEKDRSSESTQQGYTRNDCYCSLETASLVHEEKISVPHPRFQLKLRKFEWLLRLFADESVLKVS